MADGIMVRFTHLARRKLAQLGARAPLIQGVIQERDQLRRLAKQLWVPPGHFYSPLPDSEEVRRREAALFGPSRTIQGVYRGRAWNEAYLLRAFLQYNHNFQIQIWTSYLETFHRERLLERMPLCARHRGQSIWLKKL